MRLVLVLAALLVLATADRADPDLWGHVRYGQDVLAAGRLPSTTTHTFTAPDQRWINHENVAEIAFAVAVDWLGPGGLIVLKYLLGLLVIGVLLDAGRRARAGLVVGALVLLLAAFNVAPGWAVRPQLFTYGCFALLVALMDAADTRALWLAPALFAVWANAHGGFVAGWCLFALFLGCRALADLRARGRAAFPAAARAASVLALSALATLANPYGLDYLVWLVRDLAPPRPEITEWRAVLPSDPQFWPFALLLGLTVPAWIASGAWRDAARTALLLAAAWQGLAHVRHIPFFAILAGCWLPGPLETLYRRPRSAARAPGRGLRVALAAGALALALLLAERSRAVWVDKSQYPVEAFQYMADHGLVGRLVAYFDWSQYAIAAFAPDTTVAFDGRFRTSYPQEIADMHFDFFLAGAGPRERWRDAASPPPDAERVLRFAAPELVLLDRRNRDAAAIMQRQDGWVLLYQDGLAQLWGRRERYDDPASPVYLPPVERRIGDRVQEGLVPWPALPERAVSAGTKRRHQAGVS